MKRARSPIKKLLDKEFYARDTLTVAQELVGKVLEHKTSEGTISVIINETEAYSEEEPSCHAYKGKTKRTRAMFEEASTIYIYNIYGMHKCINFITEVAGKGCGVLLRGVLPLRGTEHLLGKAKNVAKLLDGPAKLVKSMKIPMDYYGMSLLDEECPLKIYDEGYSAQDIKATPRIGISQAKELEWRFIAKKFSKADEDSQLLALIKKL